MEGFQQFTGFKDRYRVNGLTEQFVRVVLQNHVQPRALQPSRLCNRDVGDRAQHLAALGNHYQSTWDDISPGLIGNNDTHTAC